MTAALCALVIASLISWFYLPSHRSGNDPRPAFLEARVFVFLVTLFAAPLPITVMLGNEGGDISEHLSLFKPWLPEALFFTSSFLICFAIFVRFFSKNKSTLLWRGPNAMEVTKFKLVWMSFFVLSMFLLQLLASDVGGVIAMVLSGYRVTELFVGQGYLAVAFEWLISLVIVLMSYGIVSKSKIAIKISLIMILIVVLMLLIMGRRGMLVTLVLAFIYLAIEAGWIKKFRRLMLPGIFLFILMNWLGMVRGASYDGAFDLLVKLMAATTDLAMTGELLPGLFYTLTHGNFVVPFETLPQIIRKLEFTQEYWLGWSIPRSLALVVPSSLLPSRPLPLANWYIEVFYGGGLNLNEGRQFFFLSEAFLNFGWFGSFVWAMLIAGLFSQFTRKRDAGIKYWELALRALFFGSLLNFVAAESSGFMVSFSKGLGLVPIVMALVERFTPASRKIRNE